MQGMDIHKEFSRYGITKEGEIRKGRIRTSKKIKEFFAELKDVNGYKALQTIDTL